MIVCPLFPVNLNHNTVGEVLCIGSLYGAIFDEKRRVELNGMFVAATDDAVLRYIVWNPIEGHFYRILPKSTYTASKAHCSFKGIFLCDDAVCLYYSLLLVLEALECLSTNSKVAISASRKEFLTEYKESFSDKTKTICIAVTRYGITLFSNAMEHPIGNLKTHQFLKLCDDIARFKPKDDPLLSDERTALLGQFIDAIKDASHESQAMYLLYLTYAQLRYFAANIKAFLLTGVHPNGEAYTQSPERLMEACRPQLQFVELAFTYVCKSTNRNDWLGRAFGSEFGSEFGREFGRAFGSAFPHLLANQWKWLVWIGWRENLPLDFVASAYFQSIPDFYVDYCVEGAKTVFDFLDERELFVAYKDCRMILRRSNFGEYLHLKDLKRKGNVLFCTLTIDADTESTIFDSSAFSLYCNQLKAKQRSIFCSEKYCNLGLKYQPTPNPFVDEISCWHNLYIFLPGKIGDADFFEYISEQKERGTDAIVSTAMEAKDTRNIIQYTYLHRQNKAVSRETIQSDYRRFLMEFVAARLEGLPADENETVKED